MDQVNNKRQEYIATILHPLTWKATREIVDQVSTRYSKISQITIIRDLNELIEKGLVERIGKGKATSYKLTPHYTLLAPVDLDKYFQIPQEERVINPTFNFQVFDLLNNAIIFTEKENKLLESLQQEYIQQKSKLSPTIQKKEFERLTIELSWKSSVIEGNTYSLLETETLLKDGIEAEGKRKEEAVMLLNHKYALDFAHEQSKQFKKLDISHIEHIHSILTKQLGVSPNLRKTLVGITGTNYKPIDNEFQVREALEQMCELINGIKNIFTKSLLSMLLISYIQPFEDGNKRTSRIVGNAILLAYDSFPLSFRNVDENDYKKATLLFYETNNLSAFKKIFIDQSIFAVKNYFRVSI